MSEATTKSASENLGVAQSGLRHQNREAGREPLPLCAGGNSAARARIPQSGESVRVKRAKPDAGTLLEIHLRELKLNFVREFKFYTERDWRADFLISPEGATFAILVEIEGSVWTQGRHTRGAGFLADMEKYNTATMLGYRVLRFSTEQVETGKAKEFLKEWL